jgi:hypothetical protein
MTEPTIKVGNIEQYRPASKNNNLHTERGAGMLEKAMHSDGYVAPITAAANGEVLDGSQRLETSADVFGNEVLVVEHDGTRPVIMVRTDIPNADTPQAQHIAVAANRVAEVDLNFNTDILAQIASENQGLLDDLFSSKEMEKMMAVAEENEDERANLEDMDGELPGVAALKDYYNFPSDLPLGMPELKKNMILDLKPGDTISTFAGHDITYEDSDPTHWLFPWGRESIFGLNLKKTIVCFYVEDFRFEGFWVDPAESVGKLLNAGVAGCIMPNFTVGWGDPLILNLWQKYRSLWVARYMQEAGIPILPDVQPFPGGNELNWVGIPREVPVAVQFHNFTHNEGLFKESVDLYLEMREALNPPCILCYADELSWRKLEDRKATDRMVRAKTRFDMRSAAMKTGGRIKRKTA